MQIPARLYVFDRNTHTWKERGRGEARLNDAAQSEGLFQSRLGIFNSFCTVVNIVLHESHYYNMYLHVYIPIIRSMYVHLNSSHAYIWELSHPPEHTPVGSDEV